MLIALFGGLVVCGAFGLFIVAAIFVLAKAQPHTTASEIDSGYVPGLLEFHPGLLAELSSTVVGSSHYYRPMGGSRTSKLAGKVPSCRLTGDVVAIRAELTPRRAQGSVTVAASNVRIDLTREGDYWRAAANGAPLGAIHHASGRLYDGAGVELGWYQRGERAPGRVVLRGVDVAWLEPGANLVEAPAHGLRPLLRITTHVPDPEASAWLLAIAGLELGVHLMPSAGMAYSGVP